LTKTVSAAEIDLSSHIFYMANLLARRLLQPQLERAVPAYGTTFAYRKRLNMERNWWVYSTAVEDGALLVEDRNSGDRGYVPDPTEAEWKAAFHAPRNPYPWKDGARVVVDNGTAAPFDPEVRKMAIEMAQKRCQGV
jgi:hypothetical protein